MGGLTDKVKGKVKEAAGAATGDESLENKGKLDQAKGSMKNAGENMKDRAKDALGDAADETKDMAEGVERKTRPDPDKD